MNPNIHSTAIIKDGSVAPTAKIREFCTLHDTVLGEGCVIFERVSLKRANVGAESFINAGCFVENTVIGERVQLGPNCTLPGVWHEFDEKQVSHEDVFTQITIGNNALLGAGTIVTPGVKIGEGAVVGAGTIVTKDIPDHYICYGPPHAQVRIPISEYLAKKR